MRICKDAWMSYEPKVGSVAKSSKGSEYEQEMP